jgi:PTS system beta-glucosides-specific IIC component
MPTNDVASGRRPLWGRRRRTEDAAAPAADLAAPAAAALRPGQVGAPVAGTVIPLAEIEDPAFSAGLLGPGIGVHPTDGQVVAPLAGTVVSAMPHAYGLRSDDGVEVLVHVGIDTVSLNGQHFEPQVEPGTQVVAGAPLVRVDLDAVAAAGLATTVVLVVTNAAALGGVEAHQPGPVVAGAPVLTVVTPV